MTVSTLTRSEQIQSQNPMPGILSLSGLLGGIGWISRSFRSQRLSLAQRITLRHNLTLALANKAAYWLCALLLFSVLVLSFGNPTEKPVYSFNLLIWSAGVWLLGIAPYAALVAWASRLSDANDGRSFRWLHSSICVWILILASWWMLGAFALEPQQKFVPGHFVLSRNSFLLITISAQVIPLVLMSSSHIARLMILLTAAAAILFAWYAQTIQNSVFVIWNFAQLGVCFILALIVGLDERRFHIRGIIEQEAKERVTTFIGSLSHDLRQPLHAMSLRLTIIKEKTRDPGVLSHIEVIDSQAKALEAMMSGTLNLALLQSGTWKVDVKPHSLEEHLDLVANDLRPVMEEQGIAFDYEVARYIVLTDKTALDRIIRNLLNNAIRYTPGGEGKSPQISLKCEVRERDRVIRISVNDNGIGIPPEKLDDVFKEFVQLSNAERNREKGFGLGLSIVRGLALLLGHRYGVTSKLGEGSSFWIEVPYTSPLPERTPPEEMEFQSRANSLDGAVVAVVEDDAAILGSVISMLELWGCRVVAGTTGEAVVHKLAEDSAAGARLNFILADYDLPQNQKGPEAIAMIRSAVGRSNVPAAIWTGKLHPAVLRELADQGLECLIKPVSDVKLWEVLYVSREAHGFVPTEA